MTESSSRLTVLREFLKLSQQEFAASIGVTQSAMSQLESGRSKLSLDTITKISRTHNVDCNWLITGSSPIFIEQRSKASSEPITPNAVLFKDMLEQCLIPLVREEAHAGYIQNSADSNYLNTLEVYRIPGYESGDYRLFEVEGTSMLPSIHPGEIVVSERAPDWSEFENGSLCIVITKDGIVAKRAYLYPEDPNLLILKSDNPDYKTYSVALENVLEIWRMRAKITNVFAQDAMVDARKIREIEADLRVIKEEMGRLSSRRGNGYANGNANGNGHSSGNGESPQ